VRVGVCVHKLRAELFSPTFSETSDAGSLPAVRQGFLARPHNTG